MMHYDKPNWKDAWAEVRGHYEDWWRRRGPVLVINGPSLLDVPRADVQEPPAPRDPRQRHTDPHWFAANQRYSLLADSLPIAFTDYGCVQLAGCFGAEPRFDDHTVWYTECTADCKVFMARLPKLTLEKDGDFELVTVTHPGGQEDRYRLIRQPDGRRATTEVNEI